jgi:type IV pilus assembly protein PilA
VLARIRKATEDKEQGFTLIELLVVIIIIGILAAIAIPTFLNQRKKGYDAAAISALRNAATAQESYLSESGTYAPSGAAGLTALTSQGFNSNGSVTLAVVGGNSSAYCMSAVHTSNTGATNTWYITNNGATGVRQGEPYKGTACTITP